MSKKRSPGGGRKPLYPEKTMKVAITLLPSQVEAMQQLGNGNLSAGIRKAIEIMYSYYQHNAITVDRITNLVIENGRVTGEGQDWLESLRNEVEFEAMEQVFATNEATEIAAAAIERYTETRS